MTEDTETKRPGPTTDLLEKIRALRIEKARASAEASKIQERIRDLTIRISAYEDAASMVFGETQYTALMAALEGNIAARKAFSETVTGGLIAFGRDVFGASIKRKSLSESWAKLLLSMAEHEAFTYDDLVTMSEIMDYDVAKPTMRSQIKTYVDSGLVERLENERGKFKVTPLGRVTAEAAVPKPEPQRPALAETLADRAANPWADLEELLGDPSSGSGGSKKNIFE